MTTKKKSIWARFKTWISAIGVGIAAAVGFLIYQFNPGIADIIYPKEDKVEDTTTVNDDKNKPQPTTTSDKDDKSNIRLTNYLPTVTASNQIVKHSYFSLSYADSYEDAEWVAYELTKAQAEKGGAERGNNFRPDAAVLKGSATPNDYKSTGYDRGHLAPAADMTFNETAMSESFFMSNMTPQEPGFNRGIWKELEEQVRDYAKQCEHVYIVTGPILPKNIEKRIGKNVGVPKSFYKIVLDLTGKTHKGIAFVIPNTDSDKPLKDYVVTIDDVEKRTGLNFFPTLTATQDKALEGVSDITKWGIDETRAQKRIMEVQMRMRSGMKLQAEN